MSDFKVGDAVWSIYFDRDGQFVLYGREVVSCDHPIYNKVYKFIKLHYMPWGSMINYKSKQ